MRVKRYIVDSLPDAVTLIRTEMGTDAVILETKDIKVGGFLGMFRKKKIEVMAAIEPGVSKKEQPNNKMNGDQVDYVIEQILKASKLSKDQSKIGARNLSSEPPLTSSDSGEESIQQQSFAAQLYGMQQREASTNATSTKQTYPNDEDDLYLAGSSVEPAVNYNAKKLDTKTSTNSASKFTVTEQFIVDELKNLREEMQKISSNSVSSRSLSPAIQNVKNRLEEQEILPNWVELIIESLVEYEIENNDLLSNDAVWDFVKQKFLEWLSPYSNEKIDDDVRVIQFVGPTGVGKTTTIAKLSAKYSINEGKQLGLITADTYRIAAVEQLRTYANILNIPLEVVFSPLDLQRAFKQLEQSELILMDTAGRNFKSDIHVSEVNSLLQTSLPSEAILVLSLTSRTQDINVIVEKFCKYGIRKVIFTKLDEATAVGSIFNMVMTYGLQPLYITSGQNVPDDIEPFKVDRFVTLLLGEPQDV